MAAVEEVATVVEAVVEVGVGVSRALMPHQWVEVDVGKDASLIDDGSGNRHILYGISSACPLF